MRSETDRGSTTGLVSQIQKYSLHDGPGIRTTVFLKGCPLQCAWCHNPENIAPRPQVVVFKGRCVRCGMCRSVCPEWAGRPADAPRESLRCRDCGACVEACPTGARMLIGQSMTSEAVLAEILADRIFYDDSNGGVTFSGGEPLAQFDFLREVLKACRSREVHTAVDTCGFARKEDLLTLAPWVDLFLYDLKLMDEKRHLEFCGVSNQRILDNLRVLAQSHGNLWIRVPVIPGINDTAEELDAMAAFVLKLPSVRQVNLLPYHRTGRQKFDRLGLPYRLPELAAPSAGEVRAVAERFAAAGLNVKTGG